jgi:aminopeptidase N
MIRSVQASLAYYTKQFGPYPHGQVRLVERPGDGVVLHASPINITYDEGFSLLQPEQDPRHIDLPFAVVAHEVAHQWWGNTVAPARAEGAALLTETLAWYSAFGVVEETLGRDHLQRLLGMMRQVYLTPRSRANVPLLRAMDQFLAYRKGPFAMHALREHVGAAQVNTALRQMLEKYGSGAGPLPTSLDLYRELQAVTPDSLRGLLADLFESNTFWELETKDVTAEAIESGSWQVTLDVQARKVAVDTAGVETEVPMDDPVEIGVFAGKDDGLDAPSCLRVHRLRSGRQKITVSCPSRPERAGIDPRHLFIDVDTGNNFKDITMPNAGSSRGR